MPCVGLVLVMYSAVVLLIRHQLVTVVKVPQLKILCKFCVAPQNALNIFV